MGILFYLLKIYKKTYTWNGMKWNGMEVTPPCMFSLLSTHYASSSDGEVLSVKFTYSFLASQYQEEWPLFEGILYFPAYLEKYSSLKELFQTAAVGLGQRESSSCFLPLILCWLIVLLCAINRNMARCHKLKHV
ncbi:hypothetical protein P8452_23461 [Trifolium repens]|nr:hypothetical protein P8452_23461 [Trifolium repens]